jgi:hypothetical protein
LPFGTALAGLSRDPYFEILFSPPAISLAGVNGTPHRAWLHATLLPRCRTSCTLHSARRSRRHHQSASYIAALPKAAIPTVFVNELFDPAEPVFGQHFTGSSQNELNGGSQFLQRVVCGIPFDDSCQFQCQVHALEACTWLMRHLNPPMLASGSE